MSSQLQTHSRCWRALASPRAQWHRARHPTGKSSGVTMCPTASDPSPGAGGLCRHHVPHATGPTTQQGRALVSPHVPWLQICLMERVGSSITTCPMLPGPPPDKGGLRCRHVSYSSRPASRCGRVLASPRAPRLSASEECPCIPKAPDIRLIMAPCTRCRQHIKYVQDKLYTTYG
jgi:hypothetical protein